MVLLVISDVVLVALITFFGPAIVLLLKDYFIDRRRNKKIDDKVSGVAVETQEIKTTQKIMHEDINGRITQLIAAKDAVIDSKDATIAGKQDLSEATGKAKGIAEKQIEVDKLNKDSKPKE